MKNKKLVAALAVALGSVFGIAMMARKRRMRYECD